MTLPATINEVVNIANRLAEELSDVIIDAKQCGSTLPAVQALVDEWEAVHQRIQHHPKTYFIFNQQGQCVGLLDPTAMAKDLLLREAHVQEQN